MTDTITAPAAMPRINEPAPDFSAKTTHGQRSLADYRGKWLVLFSHPADFTPVCTTEFMGFARHADEFKAMNTELLGLSIDSMTSTRHGAARCPVNETDHRGRITKRGNKLARPVQPRRHALAATARKLLSIIYDIMTDTITAPAAMPGTRLQRQVTGRRPGRLDPMNSRR
jgi:hypothetical protein